MSQFTPDPILQITLCQYENGTIFYQFLGLGGAPPEPVHIHSLLTAIAQAVANGSRVAALQAAQGPAITADPLPTLFAQEVAA